MRLSDSKRAKLALAAIFFTFFIDNLSYSIVFPIFAPYFLDPINGLFSAGASEGFRTTILGLFLMAFSFGQFIGAPILGEYADRYGRKKALLLSVFCTLVGLGITAWSMQKENLFLLFVGRLITGIFASNMAICLACVADLYPDEKQKAKQFGRLSIVAGFSFVVGAFAGGKLSDSSIDAIFFAALPIWLAAGLTVINLLFIWWGVRETSQIEKRSNFDFFESIENIKQAFRTKNIKSLYMMYFFFLFAWTIIFQFMPVLMVRDFEFTNSNIGDLALFMGIFWAIGSGYLNKILLIYFPSLRILEGCFLLFTLFCTSIIFPTHIYGVLGILAGCVLIGGLAWPICTGVISNAAPRNMQGKILGISQSVQSLAMALAPAIGGVASQVSLDFSFFLGALASLAAAVIYFTLKNR